ncbi:MAG: NUDIX domain-containing protein [Lachnospiraceae bacterium]|nr:NUDIX domain-containing protein [Lachnospiraceae bacterium]
MEKSNLTTLCYIEKGDQYLMLHRVKKQKDVNKDKWIGIGGHFEQGESPEDCLIREVKEETGLTLTGFSFRGIVTFSAAGWQTEYMCLYTADRFQGELTECDEGTLEWVKKEELMSLNLWEGDKIFFRLLMEDAPFFSLKLSYEGDRLIEAVLNGRSLELLELCQEDGSLTGVVRERSMVHENGDLHRTSHIWILRPGKAEGFQILMQKRSSCKDSYPGCYDISAAGHIPAGGGYLDSAVRELEEELGIQAQPEDLKEAFLHLGYAESEFYGKPFKNAEVSMVYVYDLPVECSRLKLQQEEVESVGWMDYETVLSEVRRETADGTTEKYCVFLDELEQLGAWVRENQKQKE